MADTASTVFKIVKPEVGASNNTWGTKNNLWVDGFEKIILDSGGKVETTGTAAAYAYTPSHTLVTALADGLRVLAKIHVGNTPGACTFNYNGLGAQSVKKLIDGTLTDPAADDLPIGHYADFIYVVATADWILLNPGTEMLIGTSAQLRFGTATDRFPAIDQWYAAHEEVTLTDAAPVALDMSLGINFKVTLAGNRTLSNPTNMTTGKSGFIRVIASGGTRTLSFGGAYRGDVSGGDITIANPDMTVPSGSQMIFKYFVVSDSVLVWAWGQFVSV